MATMRLMHRTMLIFPLEPDENGYPPFESESMWGGIASDGVRVDNVPYFTRAANYGDIVEIDASNIFQRLVRPSRNSLLRAYFDEDRERILPFAWRLEELGCICSIGYDTILAISIPKDVSIDGVRAFLEEEVKPAPFSVEDVLLRGRHAQ